MRARPCPRNIIQPTNIFAQPNLSEVRGGRARAKPGKINQHPFLKVAGSCPLGLAACCCLLIIAGSQLPGAVCEGRKVVGTEGAILEKGTATTMEDLRAGKLAGAKKLDLSWAKLDEVPKEVFDLADSLEVLNLQGNSISSLPDDMAKLKRLKILFLSNNKFAALPKTLGGCPSLSMLALRSCGLEEIPPESLAPNLRWLILTDNNIKELPAKIGDCDKMQKLMLSGNRIESLPSEMAGCKNLELVRLASNRLTRVPSWLQSLPKLTWVALAGNPLTIKPWDDKFAQNGDKAGQKMKEIKYEDIRMGDKLGEGASGQVFKGDWDGKEVAVKVFKGQITSDGLPECEMDAMVAAGGAHPNLPKVFGVLSGHPEGKQGLVLELVPADFKSLGGPPSFDTCSRDVYDEGTKFTLQQALRVSGGIAAACAELHSKGVMHGDIYGHNILWRSSDGQSLLGDFGAATPTKGLDAADKEGLQRLEVRALGVLLSELIERCDKPSGGKEQQALEGLEELQRACMHEETEKRPAAHEVVNAISALTASLHGG